MNDKMKRRKLTKFLCQEMLYDYAVDNLDEERKSSVEEFLRESEESQKVLDDVYFAL